MNLIHSSIRNKLNIETVSDLMIVKSYYKLSYEPEFDLNIYNLYRCMNNKDMTNYWNVI